MIVPLLSKQAFRGLSEVIQIIELKLNINVFFYNICRNVIASDANSRILVKATRVVSAYVNNTMYWRIHLTRCIGRFSIVKSTMESKFSGRRNYNYNHIYLFRDINN